MATLPTPVPTPTTPRYIVQAQQKATTQPVAMNYPKSGKYSESYFTGPQLGIDAYNASQPQSQPTQPTQPTKPTNTGLDPHINPSTGFWDDNYYAATHQGSGDQYSALRNDISSAWDAYINSLGGQEQYLNEQKAAQEGIANTSLAESQRQVGEQKATSLRDIQETARNAFQAGNNYLGSMGAGDSSAANQYKFAVDQQLLKQVGELNNFVSSSQQKIQSEHDIQIQQIAQWFAQQQQALKQLMSQGQISKAQDLNNLSKGILDQAIAWTNQVKTNTMNQQNALAQWAMNNSTNVNQLTQNMSAIGQSGNYGLQTNAPQSNNIFWGGSTVNDKYKQ